MTGSPKSEDAFFRCCKHRLHFQTQLLYIWQAPFWKSSTPSLALGLSQHKHVFYNLQTTSSNPDSSKYHSYDQLSTIPDTAFKLFRLDRGEIKRIYSLPLWTCMMTFSKLYPASYKETACNSSQKQRLPHLLWYKQPPPVAVVVGGATYSLLQGYPPTCADATVILLQVITLR